MTGIPMDAFGKKHKMTPEEVSQSCFEIFSQLTLNMSDEDRWEACDALLFKLPLRVLLWNEKKRGQKMTHTKIDMISIPTTTYDQLVKDQKWLQALEAAGVDNWEGCSEAHELLED